jgi:hypothetical protein
MCLRLTYRLRSIYLALRQKLNIATDNVKQIAKQYILNGCYPSKLLL